MNRKISNSSALLIVIFLATVLVGGISAYNYWESSRQRVEFSTGESQGMSDKLNLEDIKNASYPNAEGELVPFKDGKIFGWEELKSGRQVVVHYWEEKGDSIYGWDFTKRIEKISTGDLDNDSKEDAAVVLSYWGGGTGVFKSLAVLLNKSGKPVYLTDIDLGDRTGINSISIDSGMIKIAVNTHRLGDALCCPTLEEIWSYRLSGEDLIKIE